METVLCSSISFASLRASSTGCTCERNARPNTPSTSDSMRCSMFRRTLMAGILPGAARLTRTEQRQREDRGGEPDPEDERERADGAAGGDERRSEERGAPDGDSPQAAASRERDGDRGRGEDRKSTRLNSSHTVISYAVFC